MSRIAGEIRNQMYGFTVNGNGEASANFRFREEFIGFQGHFPERKVLPGVCQLQCVQAVLEAWKGQRIHLQEIVSAKYMVPVGPGDEISCRCLDMKEANHVASFRALITRGEEKVSDFRLRVRLISPDRA